MIPIALAALAVLAAAPAPSAPEASLPVIAGAPPIEERIWKAWPLAARSVGMEASVGVTCVITTAGTAEHCSAGSESKNAGFEAAAIGLVRELSFTPGTVGGAAVDIAAPFTIDFRCQTRCTPFASGATASRSLILFPKWLRTPTAAEIEAAWPKGPPWPGSRVAQP